MSSSVDPSGANLNPTNPHQAVSDLTPDQQALLALRLRDMARRRNSQPGIPVAGDDSESERDFPLSFAQQRLWMIDQLRAGNSAYNIPGAIRLTGKLSMNAFEQGITEIVRRHRVLRVIFGEVDGQTRQTVTPLKPALLPVVDLRGLNESIREKEINRLALEEASQPFDLTRGPQLRIRLLRITVEEQVILYTMHHIVSDGWSMGIMIKEISALYKAYRTGNPSPLTDLPTQYTDFVYWQRERLTKQIAEQQLGYWKKRLEGMAPLFDLPADRPRPAVQTFRGGWRYVTIPQPLSRALFSVGYSQGATLFVTFLAAFKALLCRYSGREDIVVGSPIANRMRRDVELLIGSFANTLVLRTDLSGNPTVREIIRRVRDTSFAAYENQNVPFEMLVAELQPERALSYAPLVQVVLNFENVPQQKLEFQNLRLEYLKFDLGAAKSDLSLNVYESSGDLNLEVGYNRDLFDDVTVNRMVRHFIKLLDDCAAAPDKRVSELRLFSDSERQQLFREWNDRQGDYADDVCVNELFEEQVTLAPDSIALICGELMLSYQALNRESNKLAHYLRRLGVGPEVLVGIELERSAALIIAILATLKAGGGYLPLDPSWPVERLCFMIEDAGAAIVLITESNTIGMPSVAARLVNLDFEREQIEKESDENPGVLATPDNVIYVIYTSGSTGRPKGVDVKHRGACNLTAAQAVHILGLQPDDRVLQFASSCFDASISEIVMALCTGATLCLLTPGQERSIQSLMDVIKQEGITTATFPPSVLGVMPGRDLSALKTVLSAGEKCKPEVVDDWSRNRRLFNAYGPTEASVCATMGLSEDRDRSAAIGRPIPNSFVYLLDVNQEPVPIGAVGEIYIGGAGVARGYRNRPDLTAARFLPNPFSAELSSTLYRTGDLARYLPDGVIDFKGRADHQIKVRGARIELGEVEAVLNSHPAVREAAVIARDDSQGRQRLIAYLIFRGELIPTENQLRALLREQLPHYMIPEAFVALDDFPLLPNGKVDRNALPEPDGSELDFRDALAAPRTPIEEMLLGMWGELLSRDGIGVHDNFFDRGGHSLLATQVISRISRAFGVDVPLLSFFETPTIAELAAKIELDMKAGKGSRLPPIERASRDTNLPLSFSQQRLWFIDRLEPNTSLYNITTAIRIEGKLSGQTLEQSLNELVRRHETLRTTFLEIDGAPVQVIGQPKAKSLPLVDLTGIAEQARNDLAVLLARDAGKRPSDLERGPLFRVRVLHLATDEALSLFNMHHIVSDGWSVGVLIKELRGLYEAFSAGVPSPLADLPIQYADFAVWQRKWLQGEELEAELTYWRKQLCHAPEALAIPVDRPGFSAPGPRATRVRAQMGAELAEQLRSVSRQEGVTLFMTLLAAFAALLYRYTGQEDIIVGTNVANRERVEIEGLIGMFVNNLVLRISLDGNPTFRELLSRVTKVCLEAYTHQDLPFEKLVEELKPDRALGHNPIFRVLFGLQNDLVPELTVSGLKLSPMEIESGTPAFDLTVSIWQREQALLTSINFNASLFDAASMKQLLDRFHTLLEDVAVTPGTPLNNLAIIEAKQRNALVASFNDDL